MLWDKNVDAVKFFLLYLHLFIYLLVISCHFRVRWFHSVSNDLLCVAKLLGMNVDVKESLSFIHP
jgi:hypothetical protein